MLAKNIFQQFAHLDKTSLAFIGLIVSPLLTGIFYSFLSFILRPIFRRFQRDIALVTLNVSTYPLTIIFGIFTLKLFFEKLVGVKIFAPIDHLLVATSIGAASYWTVEIFIKVVIYYTKAYTAQTEVMWDDVLFPILSAIVPVIIYIIGAFFALGAFGVDLTGIWVALGGVTFVLGFALQDILSNFFSGIVLLIDTPFQFGDILMMEDGSMGILRKIGIRVTQVYMLNEHADTYIPNSVLQGQKITNLSRPTTFYYHSISLEIPAECDIEQSKKLIEEIVLAHPDTLGDIDAKLEVIDDYYISEESANDLLEQQKNGKLKILAEKEIALQLEEIEMSFQALVVTIQFAEQAGLTAEEVENVKQEYQEILGLLGLQISTDPIIRNSLELEETVQGLIELIREWYRIWIKDDNLLDEDQFFISDEWERKITLLKRRSQKLYQKISNPQGDETRLDDYVQELMNWIKEKLKTPLKKWQEPKIRMMGMTCNANENGFIYSVTLESSFFIDEINLENGKRGDRVTSQIYQEIFCHFKKTYLDILPKLVSVDS
jgi:MscS family membrane protein